MNLYSSKLTMSRKTRGVASFRWVGSKLTYGNAVATVALFVALGGVSYAAAVLPAGSVGPRQLRRGAVDLRALNFPLAASSVLDAEPEITQQNACNGGGPGEGPAPPCPLPALGAPNPPRETRLVLSAPGRIAISGTVNVKKEGPASTTALLTVAATMDHRVVATARFTISGGETLQVPIQTLVRANSGRHTVGVGTSVEFTSAGPGSVVIERVSVVATAGP